MLLPDALVLNQESLEKLQIFVDVNRLEWQLYRINPDGHSLDAIGNHGVADSGAQISEPYKFLRNKRFGREVFS